MDAKKKFLELKKAWVDAKNNPGLRSQIDIETDVFFNSLSEEQKKDVKQAVTNEFGRMHNEIAEINQILNVRDSLSEVLPFISVSHLSKYYFGKSSSWFYQRMNGNAVHGKPAKFTSDEIKTLNFALKDVSTKLSAVQF